MILQAKNTRDSSVPVNLSTAPSSSLPYKPRPTLGASFRYRISGAHSVRGPRLRPRPVCAGHGLVRLVVAPKHVRPGLALVPVQSDADDVPGDVRDRGVVDLHGLRGRLGHGPGASAAVREADRVGTPGVAARAVLRRHGDLRVLTRASVGYGGEGGSDGALAVSQDGPGHVGVLLPGSEDGLAAPHASGIRPALVDYLAGRLVGCRVRHAVACLGAVAAGGVVLRTSPGLLRQGHEDGRAGGGDGDVGVARSDKVPALLAAGHGVRTVLL